MKRRKIQGTYSQSDPRFGFIETPTGEKFFVGYRSRSGALDGDFVEAISETEAMDGKIAEAKVVKILKRTEKPLFGTYRKTPGKTYGFVFLTVPERQNVYVADRDSALAVDLEAVSVVVEGFGPELSGKIIERLGPSDNFNTEREILVRKSGIPLKFDERVLMEAERFSEKDDTAKNRQDLSLETIITIDGSDSKDLDDAISVRKTENGFELGVHIADVAEYVREGSELDREALRRGTSAYLSDRVIPMLPERLSNGLCSLHPGERKLCLSIFIEIDSKGAVTTTRITETKIDSARKCTYEEVQSWKDRDGRHPLPHPEILRLVDDAFELAAIVDARRDAEGRIDFEIPETRIELDPDGEPSGVTLREHKASHKLIETFMVLANEEISRSFTKLGIPFVYRIHEPPSEENRADLRVLFKKYAIDLPHGEFSPKDLREAYSRLKEKPGIPPIEKSLLSRLSKACYSDKPLGHFGLALQYYSHFTSPIRRYPDLQIHRIIKEKLRGEFDAKRKQHYIEILPVRAKRNSESERRAEALEREVEGLETARFMEKEIGKEFDAIVVGASRLAYYVRIANGVEGAVFLGKRSEGSAFPEFGTPMRVKLISVERAYGRIDFEPIQKK